MGSLSQLPQGFGGTCRRDSNTHWSVSHASEDPKPSSCREYHWQTSFYLSLSLNGSSKPEIQLCQCCQWGYWLPATITNVVKLDSTSAFTGGRKSCHWRHRLFLTHLCADVLKAASLTCLLNPLQTCVSDGTAADVTVTLALTCPKPLFSSPKFSLLLERLIWHPGSL